MKLNQLDAYSAASKTLNEMYKTAEGKKFIHHLIYSFMSNHNYIVFSKSTLTDCLSRSEIEPVFNKTRKVEDPELKTMLNEYRNNKSEDLLNSINEKVRSYVETKLNNQTRLAVRSNLSNRLLGSEELTALTDFIQEQVNDGNQTITDMIKYMKSDHKKEEATEITQEMIAALKDKFNG